MDPTMDVMVDVAPGVTVWREDGKWFWRGPPGTTKEAVLRELAFQVRRMSKKGSLLQEAWDGLKDP